MANLYALASPPSDDNGVVNGRSNFFKEPIQYTLKGVLPHAGVSFSVMPVSQGRQNSTISSRNGLSLNVNGGEIEFISIGRKLYELQFRHNARNKMTKCRLNCP